MLICILTKNVITSCCFTMMLLLPMEVLFPYTTLFRSALRGAIERYRMAVRGEDRPKKAAEGRDRKSTRLNSSHTVISYAVFCLKKKNLLTLWVCKLLMLICILTKNVITSCSATMMLLLHLEVKPLMTLTTVLYLSCALISGHLAMMLMELTKRR